MREGVCRELAPVDQRRIGADLRPHAVAVLHHAIVQRPRVVVALVPLAGLGVWPVAVRCAKRKVCGARCRARPGAANAHVVTLAALYRRRSRRRRHAASELDRQEVVALRLRRGDRYRERQERNPRARCHRLRSGPPARTVADPHEPVCCRRAHSDHRVERRRARVHRYQLREPPPRLWMRRERHVRTRAPPRCAHVASLAQRLLILARQVWHE